MLNALVDDKNFLAFSLEYPCALPSCVDKFFLGTHTQVEIWDTGVIVFTPQHQTDTDIILSAGIHGNETAPIELCDQLITALLSQELRTACRLMFIFGNPLAIKANTRFIDENLNRLFSAECAEGKAKNIENNERLRAKKLASYVNRFFSFKPDQALKRWRIHYDLHTAIRGSKYEKFAIYPYQGDKPFSLKQLNFLAAWDIQCVLFQNEPTTTFSYFSSHLYGADAFTIELGQVRPFGKNKMENLAACDGMLRQLIAGKVAKLTDFRQQNMCFYQVSRSINKLTENFKFNFADDVKNFTDFAKDEILAFDGGKPIKVEHNAESIVFPNANVSIGQRALLTLIKIDANNVNVSESNKI